MLDQQILTEAEKQTAIDPPPPPDVDVDDDVDAACANPNTCTDAELHEHVRAPEEDRNGNPDAEHPKTITKSKAKANVKKSHSKRRDKQMHRLHRYMLQLRVLKGVTVGTMLSSLIWIVSVSTDHWLVYQFSEPHTDSQQNRIVSYTSGLWRSCVQTEKYTDCKTHLFLSGDSRSYDFFYGNMSASDYENTLSIRRSEVAFAMVTLVLMAIGNVFAIYAIRHVRYTYKRLTAGVHFLTGICALVCLEIVISIPKTVTTNGPVVKFSTTSKPRGHSHTATYGYSVILAWIVFGVYISAGVLFLLLSKKLKGGKAPTAEVKNANEPLQLTRP